MVNKNWFQKRLKVLFNIWWCPWCGRYNSVIVSMLMLLRFLGFCWENSFKENVGKLCKVRVQSKQVSTSWINKHQKSCDLKLELVTMLYGWLRIKQKSKNRSAHTAQPKTSENVMFFLEKMINTPLFLTPYLIYPVSE